MPRGEFQAYLPPGTSRAEAHEQVREVITEAKRSRVTHLELGWDTAELIPYRELPRHDVPPYRGALRVVAVSASWEDAPNPAIPTV